jgi:general secretion pathway protein B
MSYILDALRKADADRERGAAAELLGAPDAASVALPPPSTRRQPVPVWHWLVAGAAVPLVALLVWRWAAPDEPAPIAAAVTAAASATVATPVAPQPASVPASATMVAAAGSSRSEARETAPAASASTPSVAPAPAPPLPPKPAARKPAARKAPPKPPVVAANTPPLARAEDKQGPASASVRALAELPEDLRRQVPSMTIGGSVYSPQPASRMLIVNGQVMREGATLAPGLQLESIGRQSAVFSIRGQRFEMKL